MSTKPLLERNREAVAKYQQTEKYETQKRKYWYKVRYNLDFDVYLKMLSNQKEVCMICGCAETAKNSRGKIKPLAVDHCHKTGKIRGLLCHNCNVLLGRAKDNITILRNAIHYLKEYT